MPSNKKPKTSNFFNSNLTTTLSIALVLFLVGIITALTLIGSHMSTVIKENISFSVVLQNDISQAEIQSIQSSLKPAPYVKSIKYISKERAIKELAAELGENPQNFLGHNPLNASFEVKPKVDYANGKSLAKIEKQLKNFSGVKEVVYQKHMIDMVNKNLKTMSMILLGVAALFLFISVGLINNTIRLQIYSKRFTINTMKMVGATPWFIRKPFLGRSLTNGILASVMASISLGALIYYAQYSNIPVLELLTTESLFIIVGTIFFLGIMLSVSSSLIAVGKYLRFKTNDLYYI